MKKVLIIFVSVVIGIAFVFSAWFFLSGSSYLAEQAEEDFDTAVGISDIFSTSQAMILCLEEEDFFIAEPEDDVSICGGVETWPNLSLSGHAWGGCDFLINRAAINNPNQYDENIVLYQYCATLNTGEVIECANFDCL